MYLPKAHRVDDRDRVLTFLRQARSANLVTVLDGVPVATRLPILLDESGEEPVVQGHLALANPQARSVGDTTQALMIVDGPEAYVSPSNYAEKKRTGRVVPTWDYLSLHVTGELRLVRDSTWLFGLLHRLTERHETKRPAPWSIADAPRDHIEQLSKAIVGIEIAASQIEMKAKMSGDKPADDRHRLIDDLRSGTPEDQQVADLVRRTLD